MNDADVRSAIEALLVHVRFDIAHHSDRAKDLRERGDMDAAHFEAGLATYAQKCRFRLQLIIGESIN